MSLHIEDIRLARIAVGALSQVKSPRQSEFVALVSRLDAHISANSPGPLVFELSIPIRTEVTPIGKNGRPRKTVTVVLAPSLNEYAGMEPWTLTLAREHVDRLIRERCGHFRAYDCGSNRVVTRKIIKRGGRKTEQDFLSVTGGRQRIIEVVRHSSREVDEVAVDILGGKLVVDRLTWAGVIAGDQRKQLVRIPRWVRAKPDEGKLVVRVYEMP